MPRSRKRKVDDSQVAKPPTSKAVTGGRKGRLTGIIIASTVIAIILIIFGIFYYQEYVAPLQTTVIKVDDVSISMDYLMKRIRITDSDPMSMLDTITREQIILLEAPNYGIEITDEDIDDGLRLIASGESGSITESEFREWYRQQLNETNLSNSEYREITRTTLTSALLQELLAERVPTVAEQVHLHAILVGDYEEANEIRARWEAGEDFADLYREVAGDAASEEDTGDLGWVPEGINELIDYVVYERELSTGNVSQPMLYEEYYEEYEEEYYALFMVSERETREIEEDKLEILKSQALDTWLNSVTTSHDISLHGFNNGFDSETYAWINWQLSKE